MNEPKLFPIQSKRWAAPHPLQIPWSVAELAYSVYSGSYGRSQSLDRLAERGGFGPGEMDMFLPDWRERCDRITILENAIRKHRDQKADDRCWMDDAELYAALGDGNVGDNGCIGDPVAMLENCKRFIQHRCTAGGPWKTYQELLDENESLKKQIEAEENREIAPWE
jgi:hypothetical protein